MFGFQMSSVGSVSVVGVGEGGVVWEGLRRRRWRLGVGGWVRIGRAEERGAEGMV